MTGEADPRPGNSAVVKVERIRGRALQRIRAEHFSRHPLCVVCHAAGRLEVATELDHIVPLFMGGADVDANRQGLCASCHAQKTARDLGHEYRPRVRIGADGWPVDI